MYLEYMYMFSVAPKVGSNTRNLYFTVQLYFLTMFIIGTWA